MLGLDHLAALFNQNDTSWKGPVREFSLGSQRFGGESGPSLMGVVNLSPDSWYRESVSLSVESAVQRGRVLSAQGAAIVDLGAESTLAHASHAGAALQTSRLLPVIRELAGEEVLVSAETYLPEVANAALEAGAKVVNLTGAVAAEEIYRLAANHEAAVIICYVEGPHVRAVGDFDLRADPVPTMREYFAREIEKAEKCGVTRIFIDPGLGFYYRNLQDSGVRIRHQMLTFLNTFRLRELGWPICHALPHAFECFREEVRSAEPFFAVLAALGKTDLFRTHEVPRVKAVLQTLQLF